MDEKSLKTLEFDKILERLAGYCDFSVSAEKARRIKPSGDLDEARNLLLETRESIDLLALYPEFSIGGARDIRAIINHALHRGELTPFELLEVKSTLVSARNLARSLNRMSDRFPNLVAKVLDFPPSTGIIDAVTQAISDRGEILDSASEKLAVIRRDLRIVHDRLLAKLQRMVNDPTIVPMLQDVLITQRDGRYVLPLRAEFKGRIKSIVHDQSSSGATLFVEPLNIVDLNNQYREFQLEERDEERRILLELSLQVGNHSQELIAVVALIADIDLALARAKYAVEINGTEPVLHQLPAKKKNQHPGTVIRLYNARHPLLDPDSVVPIDVELSQQTFVLVITGPNTGGKTVTLKTIGLLALMSQAGILIPAHSGSEISFFKNIFADIGDEQSIEQSLSTFSSHITNINRILAKADSKSLVILDELGAGTDPQEGAALARALLEHLLKRGITTLVTTHHPELKAYAHAREYVENASVEFDLETLKPTFRLSIGLPGRSNALAIAEKLGLPESILIEAREEINPEDLRAEDLLDEIYHQRDLAEQARKEADQAHKQAEQIKLELIQHLDAIDQERSDVLNQARVEAETLLIEIREELRKLKKILDQDEKSRAIFKELHFKMEELEGAVEKNLPDRVSELNMPFTIELVPGEHVTLRSLKTRGVINKIDGEEAEIQVGNLRIRTRTRDLIPHGSINAGIVSQTRDEDGSSGSWIKNEEQIKEKREPGLGYVESPGLEINLRGNRADEAMEKLERYLDSAFLAGLPYVRIIHGKGTGKLRAVIRKALSQNPQVKSFQAGDEKEGGEGVTIVFLTN